MSKFKVGQRVHNNKEGYFCKVDNVGDDVMTWVTKDDGVDAYVIVSHLHETADDMFARLGLEKENGTRYHSYQMNGNNGYTVVRFNLDTIDFLSIQKRELVRDGYEYANSIKLHLAIHQKLVELGWL